MISEGRLDVSSQWHGQGFAVFVFPGSERLNAKQETKPQAGSRRGRV